MLSLGAISVDLVRHLQYLLHNFNTTAVGMASAVEFMAVQAHNGKVEVQNSWLQ